jgi:DNA-binding Lrp family transcriptional regulator
MSDARCCEKRLETSPSFFTNHAYVLMLIDRDNTMRMREVAQRIGITERAVQRIVEELVASGYLTIGKSGRRNTYALKTDIRLQYPLSNEVRVDDLLRLGTSITRILV